jgi:ATP-binding cassette subfamily C protein
MSALSAEEPIDSEEIPPEVPPGKSRMARVPTTMQVVAAECGAASLASILGHFRAYRPLEEVREAVGVDRDGSNALRIVRAARHFGLEAEGLQCEPENFDEITLPAILYWGLNHFVVLEGWTKNGYRIMDPALGRRLVSADEFNQEFTGLVVQMEPGEHFVQTGSPPSSLSLIMGWMRGAGVAVWLTVFVGLLLAVPMVAIPGIAATFIDSVLAEERADWMKWILGGAVIALILQSGLIVIQQLILARLEQQLSLERTSDFLQQLFRMPTTFFAQRYPGDIAERVASNDAVAGLLASKFAAAIIQVLSLIHI